MIDFKKLILAVCLVSALGLNTRRQTVFSDGFFCTLICENRPDIKGRTGKCLITKGKEVHSALVRNPGYGVWEFYAVDDIGIEDDKLCDEVVAGDKFLSNHTDTMCPSSVKYYATTAEDKAVRSYRADSSNKREEMKTLVDEIDAAVNKVFRSTGVTSRRLARSDKRANAAVRKVVRTMNHLKQEVGLDTDATLNDFPPQDKEKKEELLDGVIEDKSRRSDDNVTALVKTLVNLMNEIAKALGYMNVTQSKTASSSSTNEKDSDNLKKDDGPVPPPLAKYRSNDLSRRKRNELAYIAPPTSPPYNPPGYKHPPEDYDEENEGPTSPPVAKQRRYDTPKCNQEGLNYILPPTFPPYYPDGYYRHEAASEDNDEDSVKRESRAYDEENESLRAQHKPVDFNSTEALCALMTTQACDKSRMLYCKEDDTCCWAYIKPSTCDEDFKDCYSALSSILDTLMT